MTKRRTRLVIDVPPVLSEEAEVGDAESQTVADDQGFQALLERADRQIAQGKTTTHENLLHEFGLTEEHLQSAAIKRQHQPPLGESKDRRTVVRTG